MKRLSIRSAGGTYPVLLSDGLLGQMGEVVKDLGFGPSTKVTVITDTVVYELSFLKDLQTSLSKDGFSHQVCVVPAGDASKSLQTATGLYGQLLSFGMRRSDLIIALGGGVVGDLAGFVAATYLRGIPFIQAPTTLLSHDSSLGGKVGVNLPEGKNLVGAFYPPSAVVYDLGALAHLPRRQWINGMAEVIKHGIIGNPDLFAQLEAEPLTQFPGADKLEPILASAMQVKIDVVESDERESNRRQVLNVGHTIGHAVEQLSHYRLGHGEAISIGMVLEAQLAVARKVLSEEDAERISRVLHLHGLPTQAPGDAWADVAGVIDVDKKHGSKDWTFALPTRVGNVDVYKDIRPSEVQAVYEQSMKEGSS